MTDVGLLALLAGIAAFMAGLNLWILFQFFPRHRTTPTWSRAILVAYLLAASVALWVSVVFDLLSGNGAVGWTAVMFGLQFMMMAPFVWVVPLILKGDHLHVRLTGWSWPVFLSLLVLANELAMGASFVGVLGGTAAIAPAGAFGPIVGTARSILSVWFLWVMFANMVPLLLWAPLGAIEKRALLALAASGLVAPLVEVQLWAGLAAVSIVMAGAVGFLVARLLQGKDEVTGPWLLTGVVAAFAGMVLGQAGFLMGPGNPWAPVPFAFVMLVVMGAELLFVVRSILVHSDPPAAPVGVDAEVNSAAPAA